MRQSIPNGFRAYGLIYDTKSRFEHWTLLSLGVDRLIKIKRDPTQYFVNKARSLLSGMSDISTFLRCTLPYSIPPYVIYDAVLKKSRSASQPLSSEIWSETLGLALEYIDYFNVFLEKKLINEIYLSHPWGLPYSILTFMALQRSIKVTHITSYNEALRLRRMSAPTDYFKPVEHLNFSDYCKLSTTLREKLITSGRHALELRVTGCTSDINARRAFMKNGSDTVMDLIPLSLQSMPRCLICFHVWYDFPHTFAMSNFIDFHDWAAITLSTIRKNSNVVWLLKPHPVESWYGGFSLIDLIEDLPPNIIVLDSNISQYHCLQNSDCVVTVHGTVGLEASVLEIPVVCADRSFYSDWPFVYTASSQFDYITKLLSLDSFLLDKDRSSHLSDMAAACSSLTLSTNNRDSEYLSMYCDSLQNQLYFRQILTLFFNSKNLQNEVSCLSEWLNQHTHSYHVYKSLKMASID